MPFSRMIRSSGPRSWGTPSGAAAWRCTTPATPATSFSMRPYLGGAGVWPRRTSRSGLPRVTAIPDQFVGLWIVHFIQEEDDHEQGRALRDSGRRPRSSKELLRLCLWLGAPDDAHERGRVHLSKDHRRR